MDEVAVKFVKDIIKRPDLWPYINRDYRDEHKRNAAWFSTYQIINHDFHIKNDKDKIEFGK